MQEVLTGNGRTALLLALGLLALPARGIEFGEIEILSPLGEKLDARIPLKTGAGEWFHVTCIALAPPAAGASLPTLPGATLSVERRRDSANLRLKTSEPVNDPALGFKVTSTCAGATQPPVAREFSMLLDPPEVFARQQRARPAPAAAKPAPIPSTPAPVLVTPPPVATARAPSPIPRREPTPAPRAEPPAPPTAASAPTGKQDFVLKLSSSPIDVARSRQFDDKSRALLRERLRLLDNDDQVAAMLSMRDNLQRLEARVAELQLKLATTTALAESQSRTRAEPAPKAEPPPAPPPARIEPPAAPPPPVAKIEPPAPTPAPAPKASPRPSESSVDFLPALPGGPLPWLGALALLLIVLAYAWIARRRDAEVATLDDAVEPESMRTTMMPRVEPEEPDEPPRPVFAAKEEPVFEVAAAPRPEIASDAVLATRLEEDTEALSRRYLEERFPEIRDRTIDLDDPGSVVKGARLFYEDGAIPKSVELLRFATEDRPAEIRPWLALFEIYRLERLAGEYSELAARFQEHHGNSEQWAKVRALGRELDPANPAFKDPAVNPLETIGPRESRRLAIGPVDPIAENWLEAPMDFENEVLATELRRVLMARASVEERDLVANPMPALRSVEMFSVG